MSIRVKFLYAFTAACLCFTFSNTLQAQRHSGEGHTSIWAHSRGGVATHAGGGEPGFGGTHRASGGEYAHVGRDVLKSSKRVSINHQSFVRRTYVNNHRAKVHVTLAPRVWGNHPYYCYYQTRKFHSWFWGFYWGVWAPYSWNWAWYGELWYPLWGWYFPAYTVYPGPAYLALDIFFIELARGAHEAALNEGRASVPTKPSAPMTSAQKAQLLAQMNDAAKNFETKMPLDVKDTLSKSEFMYPVNSTALLTGPTQPNGCTVSEGDWIQVVSPPSPNVPIAEVKVVSSPFGHCANSGTLHASVMGLQEMLNHFGELSDQSLHIVETATIKNGEVSIQGL